MTNSHLHWPGRSSSSGRALLAIVTLVAALAGRSASEAATGLPAAFGNADLGVTITDAPDPVDAGAELVLRFDVENIGPASAQEAMLEGHLPEVFGILEMQTTHGQVWCDPMTRSVFAAFGDIQEGVTASVTVRCLVDPAADGTYETQADVWHNANDPDPYNNFYFIYTQVAPAGCVCGKLDVKLARKVGGEVKPGIIDCTKKTAGGGVTFKLDVPYFPELTCAGAPPPATCDGDVRVVAASAGWTDGNGGIAPTAGSETIIADIKAPAAGNVTNVKKPCAGGAQVFPKVARYTVAFNPAVLPVKGQVTINWDVRCGGVWIRNYTAMIRIDTTKGGGTLPANPIRHVDYANSDFDGDGKINKADVDKFPYDPTKW